MREDEVPAGVDVNWQTTTVYGERALGPRETDENFNSNISDLSITLIGVPRQGSRPVYAKTIQQKETMLRNAKAWDVSIYATWSGKYSTDLFRVSPAVYDYLIARLKNANLEIVADRANKVKEEEIRQLRYQIAMAKGAVSYRREDHEKAMQSLRYSVRRANEAKERLSKLEQELSRKTHPSSNMVFNVTVNPDFNFNKSVDLYDQPGFQLWMEHNYSFSRLQIEEMGPTRKHEYYTRFLNAYPEGNYNG